MHPKMTSQPPRTVLASLNGALHALMEEDERVIVIGEDILDPYGGAFKVTRGLSQKFPNRVYATPISEAAIVGMAIGMAMRGFRLVAEIMFGDFMLLAADQLVNHGAKLRWMYDEKIHIPLVIRTPMGGRRGYGPTHSQCLEKHFFGVPGLFVIAPHVLLDPGNLLRQCVVMCEEPVLFIEDKTGYGKRVQTELPDMAMEEYTDEQSLFPTLYVHHRDAQNNMPDGLLFCYGGMVPLCLEAVRELRRQEGLLINIAVLAQLSPPPMSHIRKIVEQHSPSVCVYAEEANPIAGWGSEMIAQIEQFRKETLQTSEEITHCRIGASLTPIASSRELELCSLPQVADIVEHIVRCF